MLLAFIIIVVGGGGEASAQSYLCSLNPTEVDDLLDDYGAPLTYQDVAPFVAAPFDCDTYGDLCGLVGPDNAQGHLCSLWDRMRNGDSATAIQVAMAQELEVLVDDWFDERFPFGVGGAHPYLGPQRSLGAPPPSSCLRVDSVRDHVEGGPDYILKARAFTTNLGAFWEIGAISKMLKETGEGTDVWNRYYFAEVTMEGDFESPAGCSEDKTETDTDGRVSVNFSGFLFNKPYEEVVGRGQGEADGHELSGTHVCAEAGWTDPC